MAKLSFTIELEVHDAKEDEATEYFTRSIERLTVDLKQTVKDKKFDNESSETKSDKA